MSNFNLVGEQVTAQEVLNDFRATEAVTSQAANAQAAISREARATANQARRNREALERLQRQAIQSAQQQTAQQSNYLRRVGGNEVKTEPPSRSSSAGSDQSMSGPPTPLPATTVQMTSAGTDPFRRPRTAAVDTSVGTSGQLRYFRPQTPVTQGLRTVVMPFDLPQPLTYPIPTTIYPTRFGPMTAPDYYIRPIKLTRKRRRTSPGCCATRRGRRPSYRKKLATRKRCRDKLGRFVRC
jgi:hypothetical protein